MVSSFITSIFFAAAVGRVNAFWRLECDGSVALARLDPLIAPGEASDHVHSIKGGSGFSQSSTYSDLLSSKCTSCGVEEDRSAYWAPAMYFIHDDGTAEVVPEKPPHKSYYLIRSGLTASGKPQTVEPFPLGFQMIAGNNFNRNSTLPDPDPSPLGPWPNESQEKRAQRAIGFNCLHYAAGNDEPSLMRHELPTKEFMDQNCADGIRLELMFPSCWNGEKDSLPLHKSHVAYPDGVSVGNCPKGYDRRLVTLFYETIVATDQFKGKPGKFVLANGDPTGYGYHGDFIAAWQGTSLGDALKACDAYDSSGDMRACPVFTLTKNSASCKIQSPLPASIQKENVRGPINGLANGHSIYYGPAPAPPPAAAGAGNYKPKEAPAKPPPEAKHPAAAKVFAPIYEIKDQNVVPTAAFSSLRSPVDTDLPTEPKIGVAHEKVVIKPSSELTSSAAAVVSRRTTSVTVHQTPDIPPPAAPPPSSLSSHHDSPPAAAHPKSENLPADEYILYTITKTMTKTTTNEFNATATSPAKIVEDILVTVEEIVIVGSGETVPESHKSGKGKMIKERDASPDALDDSNAAVELLSGNRHEHYKRHLNAHQHGHHHQGRGVHLHHHQASP